MAGHMVAVTLATVNYNLDYNRLYNLPCYNSLRTAQLQWSSEKTIIKQSMASEPCDKRRYLLLLTSYQFLRLSCDSVFSMAYLYNNIPEIFNNLVGNLQRRHRRNHF